MKRSIPWKLLFVIAGLILLIIYIPTLLKWIGIFWGACVPLLLGCALAFLVNLIMVPVENWLKKCPVQWIVKASRGLAVLISILVFTGVLILLAVLVIPQLVDSIQLLIKTFPTYMEDVQDWLEYTFGDNPQIAHFISSLNIDWNEVGNKIMTFLSSGMQGALNSAFSVVSSVISGTVNSIIMLIFAIYLLCDKERFVRLYHRLCRLCLTEKTTKTLTHALVVTDKCFRSFVTGQLIEALILGVSCTAGMLLLNIPYATMIGPLVGVTNIIPMIGAFIGGAIGVFLVFTVSPVKALIFLVFLCIIQQIESNVFYPRVVGNSVGLPGIYVTMVVVISGTLAGVPGMLIGIPLMAALYKLLREYVAHKEKQAGLTDPVPAKKE